MKTNNKLRILLKRSLTIYSANIFLFFVEPGYYIIEKCLNNTCNSCNNHTATNYNVEYCILFCSYGCF